MYDDELRRLTEADAGRSAREVVRGLELRENLPPARPRLVAAMIASADGRAALGDRSVGLGNPADRALLRELRTAADAILVGTATLRAERYANLLDEDQRAARLEAGRDEHPIVVTASRSLDVPVEIGLFAEPAVRIAVFTDAEGGVAGRGAQLAVRRMEQLSFGAILERLRADDGVEVVLCEGGPTVLERLVVERVLDELLLTLAPLLAGGQGAGVLAGPPLDPPARLRLREVLRAGDHLVLRFLP